MGETIIARFSHFVYHKPHVHQKNRHLHPHPGIHQPAGFGGVWKAQLPKPVPVLHRGTHDSAGWDAVVPKPGENPLTTIPPA